MNTGEEKRFSFEVVLSVVTGLMLGQASGLHHLIEHMVGDAVFTHQLPRVGDVCKRVLVEMFPGIDQLIDVDAFVAEAEAIRSESGNDAVGEYCAKVVAEAQVRFGQDELSIPAGCAAARYVHKDPVAEMIEMRGGADEIIIPEGCAANPAQKLHEMHSGGNKDEVTS